MTTKLERISQLSKENPEMKFTSLAHLVNVELLKDCYNKLDADKAVGIDKVTKADYGVHLAENLADLVERMKNHTYKPKPARRVEIPKDNGKTRPLSIYCFEDKLVQEALRRIFRPHRNCHQAICMLGDMIENHYTNYILDADIAGFFDNIDQDMALKLMQGRIADPNFLWLVKTMLKAGIMRDYVYEHTEKGCGQGSVCSPIIANIVMHYMLVWWFKEQWVPRFRGYAGLVVYADDFVVCFQHKDEASFFLQHLKGRMVHYGLRLQEDKTRLIEFGKFAVENAKRRGSKPETFDFLGFTHYPSTSRKGMFRVKRKTAKKKFAKKCREMNKAIREKRTGKLEKTISWINQVLVGYNHYYGITDNYKALSTFRLWVIKRLFYWLNRRSQRKSLNWDQFNELLRSHPIVKPKIFVDVYEYPF